MVCDHTLSCYKEAVFADGGGIRSRLLPPDVPDGGEYRQADGDKSGGQGSRFGPRADKDALP